LVRKASIAALNGLGRRAVAPRSNDITIGVMEAGHLTAARVVALLQHADGTTELVTHPGIGVDAYPHWRYAWEEETAALCDRGVREAIASRGIELIAPSRV
jgi:hypothetical protein